MTSQASTGLHAHRGGFSGCMTEPKNMPKASSNHAITPTHSRTKRLGALSGIRSMIRQPVPPPVDKQAEEKASQDFQHDLSHAETLIARGVTQDSWTRNHAWVQKFRDYIQQHCPNNIRSGGVAAAANSIPVVLAFLARVESQDPGAKTRVASAKRAVNLVRALDGKAPVESSTCVKLLAKAANTGAPAPQGQSNTMPIVFLKNIVRKWGHSPIWWQRQTALMALLATCAITRGAGIRSCVRNGISWIRNDGTVYRGDKKPVRHCSNKGCNIENCVRGFLLLLPYRKNGNHSRLGSR